MAQPTSELERLQKALQAGNAQAVLAEAAERVEVSLLGSGKLYSRAQATYVLEAFFGEHPPERFTLDHTSSADGSWFMAGAYRAQHAEHTMQVYLRLRQRDGRWELREIRIEQRP